MSLETPTTQEVNDNIIANLEASLNQTIPQLFKSFMRVLSKTLAGVFILLYKYGGFVFEQSFIKTASNDETVVNGKTTVPLAEWGAQIGVEPQYASTQARVMVDVGIKSEGETLPAGSQLLSNINGVTYLTISSTLLSGAMIAIPVRAASDQSGGDGSGAIGNLDPGASISFANPLPSVEREAEVQSMIENGVDAETTDAYRARVLHRWQARPQGGAYADYYEWGVSVPTVKAVYPYTGDWPNTVDVYVEGDEGEASQDQLIAVLDAINFDDDGRATRKPVSVLVNTYSAIWIGFETRITGLSVDNLAQVQSDIDTAVSDYYDSRAPYIVGLTPLPQENRVTNSGVAGVVDDVISAAGGVFSKVEVTRAGVFVDVYTLGIGQKAESELVIYQA